MNAFHVWIRNLGDFCRVRVDGLENARWLLGRLSESFVFQTCEGTRDVEGSSCCTFQVPYNPPLSPSKFKKLLAAIPVVKLMSEPE